MTDRVRKARGHFVVAIGASAGGLEAIHEFFDNMPESDNLSYIIIQHLSPDYKSLLVELVSRHTSMKVFEAEHNLAIRPNCIYVIPNNKLISIHGNKLILSQKGVQKAPNNAVDVFLTSLATEKKERAIAVILSGTGTDGTKGIASVKEEGGLVIAQEPGSSKFDGMPNSAIMSGNVDLILPPGEIPQHIIAYLNGAPVDDTLTIDDDMLQRICAQIHHQAGIDFHYYKTPTITRRVFHRMKKGKFETVEAYYDFLKDNPEECRLLGKDFLINVTRFFRDGEAFEVIKHELIPQTLKSKKTGEQLKVWVCACSTGEEAYSLAILIDEVISDLNLDIGVKFFATDIERSNIEIASKGFYPDTISQDLSEDRLNRYFIKQESGYTIIPRIRKQIVFAQHSVTKDPPFIKNDLVSCRNMLIYMDPALQQRVYSILLFSLAYDGILFLGTTENPNPIKVHLQEISSRLKLYRKVSDAKLFSYSSDLPQKSRGAISQAASIPDRAVDRKQKGLWEDLKESLFSEFNFAAFYIDRNFEIKEAVGNFDQILSLPKKILKLNLLRMLPPNISNVLIGEIKSVWSTGEQKVVKNMYFKQRERDLALQILIKRDLRPETSPYLLVAFHFMHLEQPAVPEPTRLTDPMQNDYLLSLEEELNDTKEHLQNAIENLETANEELQSSNEELLSANEELQSSNEELQSLNEELHTLNTEHQIKIRELVELNDDLNNYFRSSNVGQIFLDKNLAIRKFNPAVVPVVNFIESDVGRPITDIATNLRYSGMVGDIEHVLKTGENIEKEVKLVNGTNLLLRIMPYITQDQVASGIIISFFDITTITNLNNIIRGVFDSSVSAIFALESARNSKNQIDDFKVLAVNRAAAALLKKDPDNVKGLMLKKHLGVPFMGALLPQFLKVVESEKSLQTDIFYDKEKTWFEVTAVKMADGLVATFTDVTQKKNAEDRLKRNYVELVATKESLKKLNNELEKKVAERTQMLTTSEERFRLVARATNDAIWDWDLVNNNIWFSDAFFQKFGYDPDRSFSRADWMASIHSDDRAGLSNAINDSINSGKKQWSREYRFRKANGEYADILDRGYIMHDDFDTPFRMVGSMLDLTDLKKAEKEIERNIEQRRFLADSMPLSLLTANADGHVDFSNSYFQTSTGITRSETMEDGWQRAIHEDDLDKIRPAWDEAIKQCTDFEAEVRLRLSTGDYQWNILRAKARKDESGHLAGWLITLIDINEQKQLHELLERKVEERTQELLAINHALEESNHDLQQFASVASHDLQEPLRKIHMYADMLQNRYGNVLGKGVDPLKKILQSSSRMKSIIHNILNYSKLSAENVRFVKTDINALIHEILEDLELSIQEKNAVIELAEFPPIETIPGQIRQVFQNIIGNALKFSRAEVRPKISISAERIESRELNSAPSSDGEYCRITIKDNGIGFDDKFANRIFFLFHRLHSKDAFEGTGIGLAIVKKIIEKHQGLISATGEVDQGATFTIILPLKHRGNE